VSTAQRMSTVWRAAFALAFAAVVVAAAVTWLEVFDRLRAADPVPARGTPAAIVWSERVFRSEAELASWLRRRGINYGVWARKHPAAVSILRSRDRAAAAAVKRRPERKAAQPQRRSEGSPAAPSATEQRISTPVLLAIGVAALALLAALGVLAASAVSTAPISRLSGFLKDRRAAARPRIRLSLPRLPARPLRPLSSPASAASAPARERVVDQLMRAVEARPAPIAADASTAANLARRTEAEKLKAQALQRPFPKELPKPVARVEPKELTKPVARVEAVEPAPVVAAEPIEPPAKPRRKRSAATPTDGPPNTRRSPRRAKVADVPAQPACEVRWWRGYISSQFWAVVTHADGTETTLRVSPSFRWRRNEPPPETPEAVGAFRSLVASLELEGWRPDGQGRDWFSVRMSPPANSG